LETKTVNGNVTTNGLRKGAASAHWYSTHKIKTH